MAQASVLVEIALPVEVVQTPGQNALAECARKHFGIDDSSGIDEDLILGSLQRIERCARALLLQAGMPVFSNSRVELGAARGAATTGFIVLPIFGGANVAGALAIKCVLELFNRVVKAGDLTMARDAIKATVDKIRRLAPTGINTVGFLKAAHETGVPWRPVGRNVIQFGWGAKARWLDSTFTDRTSQIGSSLARDKHTCASVLRDAGLPVPTHQFAKSADHAVALASELGYPVVVKPANLDGGRGVSAGLMKPEGVSAAFERAHAMSRAVLVEKHVEGNDYRLQVFNGRVFWATHRTPAGVTGDGVRTFKDLLAETNADPRRGEPGGRSFLKRIPLDGEALELIEEQGLTPDAVVETGRFVRLRRAANVASGGIPLPVLEIAHPDNLALGVRAVRILRLDLGGVDLLMPDIRRSWRETGATICEVNAQPQLSPHLPGELLKELVQGQGRIPAIAVLGRPSDAPWLDELCARLAQEGLRLGMAAEDGAWINGTQVVMGPTDPCAAGVALLADPDVGCAVFFVDDDQVRNTGMPVDRLDALVVTSRWASQICSEERAGSVLVARMLGQMSGVTLVDDHSEAGLADILRLPVARIKSCAPEETARELLAGAGFAGLLRTPRDTADIAGLGALLVASAGGAK